MRTLLLFTVVTLALPSAAQQVREASRLDRSLEGERFVMHWSDVDEIALADAGRALATLERARVEAGEERWPAVDRADEFKIDVIVTPAAGLVDAAMHTADPALPHLRVSPAVFALPELAQEFALARAYLRAVLLGEDCVINALWADALSAAFARRLAPRAPALDELVRAHLEDGGRFGGAGNLLLLLAFLEEDLGLPVAGPAVAVCEPAFPLDQALGQQAGNDRDRAARFFAALFVDRAALPEDLAEVLGDAAPLETVFPFEFRFEELQPGAMVAFEQAEPDRPGVLELFADPRVVATHVFLEDGAWRGEPVLDGEALAPAERSLLVFFHPGFDDAAAPVEWSAVDEGFDDFFDEECELDPCACFGECGPGPCAGQGVPRTAPWGALALLVLATGTARAGGRRRRAGARARAARPAPRG